MNITGAADRIANHLLAELDTETDNHLEEWLNVDTNDITPEIRSAVETAVIRDLAIKTGSIPPTEATQLRRLADQLTEAFEAGSNDDEHDLAVDLRDIICRIVPAADDATR